MKRWNSTLNTGKGFRDLTYNEKLARLRDKQGKRPTRFGLKATAPFLRQRKALRARPDRKLIVWSKAVRERDDYVCQMTGTRDVKRNIAHHVAPRSRRPDLRLDPANGKTLTPEAHQWVHDHPIQATALGLLSSETFEKARKAA
jgi:hypothetical protein